MKRDLSDLIFAVCISIAFAIIIFMVSKSIVDRKRGMLSIKNLLVSADLLIFILIFPQYYANAGNSIITSIVFSFLYSLKSLSCSQSWDLCRSVQPTNSIIYILYYALIYIDFIVVPLFTVSFLISVFGNFGDKIRLYFYTYSKNPIASLFGKNKVMVFSCLSENSVSLAKSLGNKKGTRFIFCGYNTMDKTQTKELVSEARKLNAILTGKDSQRMSLSIKKKEIEYFEISKNETGNLNSALTILEKHKESKDYISIIINVFAMGRTAETLIDKASAELDANAKIEVRIIDEIKNSCYKLFSDRPLYLPLLSENNKHKISVLVIGGGYTGIEMVKAANWCGQLCSASIEINVIDKDPLLKSSFLAACPELTPENGYTINFWTCDVMTSEFYTILNEHCSETNYIIVCMSDDTLNIETAIKVKEHYLRKLCYNKNIHKSVSEKAMSLISVSRGTNHKHSGIDLEKEILINVRVRDREKNTVTNQIRFTGSDNTFHTFGSTKDIFSASNLKDELIDKLARYINKCYFRGNVSYKEMSKQAIEDADNSLMKNSYNRRNSLAAAIHIKYKLYDLIPEMIENGKTIESLSSKDIAMIRERLSIQAELNKLAQVEHRRWNAFMRAEGYMGCTSEEVSSYIRYNISNKHQLREGKLHPTITDWQQVDEFSKLWYGRDEYEEITEWDPFRGYKNFQASDYDICYNIPNMLDELKESINGGE